MVHMRKFYLMVIVLIIVMSLPALAVKPQPVLEDTQQVEAFFDSMINLQTKIYKMPGAVVAVVKDGKIIFSKGYGYGNVEEHLVMEPDSTLIRPGSISKLFIWTSVMQLVEQGKLDLDRDINVYIDFLIPNTLVTDPGSVAEPITLRHLLNHTGGFEEKAEHLFVLDYEDVLPLKEYLQIYMPARIYPPGEQIAYSNYGSSLAAYIVERVTVQNFADYVERNIFQPLGMGWSTFRQPVHEGLTSNLAKGYRYIDKNNTLLSGEFEIIHSYPAGSLSTTANDLAKFMIAHLQNGHLGYKKILQRETALQMHTQSFTPHPKLEGMAHGFIEMNRNGRRILSHGGDTFLFHSGLYLIPEENVGLFVSYNVAGSTLARRELLTAFMDEYFPSNKKLLDGNSKLLAQGPIRTGWYYLNRNNETTYEALLRLVQPIQISVYAGFLAENRGGKVTLYAPVEPNLYYSLDQESKMVFKTDEDGKVTQILTNSPIGLIPAPWYETPLFNLGLVGGYLLMFVATLVWWGISFFKNRQSEPGKHPWKKPRMITSLFGGLATAMIAGLVLVVLDLHPVFGVPHFFLEKTPALTVIVLSAWTLLILGVILLIQTVQVWYRKYGNLWERVHYTLVTGWSLVMLGWFYYWNLLGI